MAAVLRAAGAIAAGLAVAFILVVAVEFLSAVVHPFPPGFNETTEEICQYVAGYPQWMLAVAAVLWGVTAFASSWTAGRLGNRGCALVIGFLLLSAAVLNIAMLPYPIWFKMAAPIVIATGTWWSLWLSGRRKAPAANASS